MRYRVPDAARADLKRHEALRYLKYVVTKQRSTDGVIHNYLLSVLVADADDATLLSYLDPHKGAGGATAETYDPKYALRLCTRAGKTAACVFVYSQLGMHEESVKLSLRVGDAELAKVHADKPADESLRKKLWLEVARHVVREDRDIRRAIALLKECELLKIEDVLPLFPDFVLIDDFKEEICASLEEYCTLCSSSTRAIGH